jgi:YHS domain-containing protein
MKKYPWAFVLLFLPGLGVAQNDGLRTSNFNIKKSIAIEGYDPVSYFDNTPLEGKAEFFWTYRGVTYQFANAVNLKKFVSTPEKYEPAYGGWCAYAMGESGEKVKIDPETFKIVEGRIYLFYNFWGNNTLKEWNKNERELKPSGDKHWKKFVP